MDSPTEPVNFVGAAATSRPIRRRFMVGQSISLKDNIVGLLFQLIFLQLLLQFLLIFLVVALF